jgi:hypothetical protein
LDQETIAANPRASTTSTTLRSEIERLKEANRILLEESNIAEVSNSQNLSFHGTKSYCRINQEAKGSIFTQAQVDELKHEHKLQIEAMKEQFRKEQFDEKKRKAYKRRADWLAWAAFPRLWLQGKNSLILENLVAGPKPNCDPILIDCDPILIDCALEIIRHTDPQNEMLRCYIWGVKKILEEVEYPYKIEKTCFEQWRREGKDIVSLSEELPPGTPFCDQIYTQKSSQLEASYRNSSSLICSLIVHGPWRSWWQLNGYLICFSISN